MSLLAFGLIIISACMHATWNYLAKRSKGGTAFVWLYTAISAIIYAPFVTFLLIYQEINIGWIGVGMIAGSAVIHLAYSLTLQKGYRVGDFSLIYPIARGTGPMLVAISAIFLYDEHLTPLGITGIALIVLGVFVITGGLHIFTQSNAFIPVAYGVLVGVIIASYTLLDKGAVNVFLVPPLLLNYGSIIGQLLLLSPVAKRNWKEIRSDWKQHRKEAIGVGILNPLAYILILTTMVFTPVSHVAPVRELSILFGAIMGTVLLSEGFGKRRIIAAGIMVVGVVAVALS